MDDTSKLLNEVTMGRLTRRGFMRRAAALGLSAPLASLIAAQPEAAFAQDAAAQPGPAVDVVTFGAYNVDQAPLNIQNGDIDLYLFSLKTAGARDLEGAASLADEQAAIDAGKIAAMGFRYVGEAQLESAMQ